MAGEGGAPQRTLVLCTPPDEEHHRLEVVVRKGGAGDLLQHRACADQSADTHAQRATAGVSRRAAVEKFNAENLHAKRGYSFINGVIYFILLTSGLFATIYNTMGRVPHRDQRTAPWRFCV